MDRPPWVEFGDADVIDRQPARWGFSALTDLVTMRDGRRLVVQRLPTGDESADYGQTIDVVSVRLRSAGIPTPEVLNVSVDGSWTRVVYAFVDGVPGPELLERGGERPGAIDVAQGMGSLLPILAAVPVDHLGLDATWASADRLTRAAEEWMRDIVVHSGSGIQPTLHRIVERSLEVAPAAAGFAHGDFAPANILMNDRCVTGLVDLGSARCAHPLFDPAWWGLIVRFHHPLAWRRSWQAFLDAGSVPSDVEAAERMRALALLRVVELMARDRESRRQHWLTILTEATDWKWSV